MGNLIVTSIVVLLTLVTVVSLRVRCGCRKQPKKENKDEVSDMEEGRYRQSGDANENDTNCEPTLVINAQSTSSVEGVSQTGLLTRVAVLLCGGGEQSSTEKPKKENKDEVPDKEDGRCITSGVDTKIDANYEQANAHSTSSVDPGSHRAGEEVLDEVISIDVAIRNNEPTLLHNAQTTSSVDPAVFNNEKVAAKVIKVHHPITVQSVRGLQNLGNTCYFNSALQALVHTNSKFSEELEIPRTKGEFVQEVLNFFRVMQTGNSKPYSPDKLHRLFGEKSPRFADYRQHDSHECLRNFLDNIRKEERDNSGAVDKRRILTVVDSVFGGHFITVYICEDCGTPYHVFEALLDISLPIMIDEEDLAVMDSARTSNQNESMIDMLRSQWSKLKQWVLQSDKSNKCKLSSSPIDPDFESTAIKDDLWLKTSKKTQDNTSDVTIDQSTSNTENSIAEIHSITIRVQPMARDNADDMEKDKQNVSRVTVEEVTDNAEQEKDVKHSQQRGNKRNVDKEVEDEEETKQANNVIKCVDQRVQEDDEYYYHARAEVKHKQDERADDDEVTEKVVENLVKEVDCDHYRGAIDELMTALPLSSPCLPNDERATKKRVTIHDCLSYFTRKEHIYKEYLCNDCYGRNPPNEGEDPLLTSATKQTLIFNPPAILTLHLKRFELKEGGSVKRNDMITYEELLDIAPYCSSRCLRNDPPSQNIWYSLYGVVVHHGSTLKFGHYTAYVKIRDHESEADFEKLLQKNFFDRDLTKERLIEMMQKKPFDMVRRPISKPPNGTWYCIDDSSCRKVSVRTVLNQEAYLLFYERIS